MSKHARGGEQLVGRVFNRKRTAARTNSHGYLLLGAAGMLSGHLVGSTAPF
jgi:hypothetical protein